MWTPTLKKVLINLQSQLIKKKPYNWDYNKSRGQRKTYFDVCFYCFFGFCNAHVSCYSLHHLTSMSSTYYFGTIINITIYKSPCKLALLHAYQIYNWRYFLKIEANRNSRNLNKHKLKQNIKLVWFIYLQKRRQNYGTFLFVIHHPNLKSKKPPILINLMLGLHHTSTW
jgi:hypothetical protein